MPPFPLNFVGYGLVVYGVAIFQSPKKVSEISKKKEHKDQVFGSGDRPVGWGSSTRRGGGRKLRAIPRNFVFLAGKKKAYTALLQCRTFLCRKNGVHRGKISVVDMVFLVFIGFLYPPPAWKVFLSGQKSSPKDFLSVVVVYAFFFSVLGFRREEPGMSREFCRDVPDPWRCSKSFCKKSSCAFFVPYERATFRRKMPKIHISKSDFEISRSECIHGPNKMQFCSPSHSIHTPARLPPHHSTSWCQWRCLGEQNAY